MKFSIIVPCYNASKYLGKCLLSILNQNFQDWEIILVNDGSTDNTGNIINIYSKKDARIRTISQKNQGLSSARNNGIKKASGEYILFLDSDDWYKDETCLDKINEMTNENNPDIITFRYRRVMDNGDLYEEDFNLHCFEHMKNDAYIGEEYLYQVLSQSKVYMWFVWRYAIKRVFWINNQFEFNTDLYMVEDLNLIYKVIIKAQKICILNEPIYYYRMAWGGLSSPTKKFLKSRLNTCECTIDDVNKMDLSEDMKCLLNNNFSNEYFAVLIGVNYLIKDDRKEIFELLKKNLYLMEYALMERNVMIKKITYILGVYITSKLLYIGSKAKRLFIKK